MKRIKMDGDDVYFPGKDEIQVVTFDREGRKYRATAISKGYKYVVMTQNPTYLMQALFCAIYKGETSK